MFLAAPCISNLPHDVQEKQSMTFQAKKTVVKSAKTLAELDKLYVDWVGYSIVEDDPGVTFEEVLEILTEYAEVLDKETEAYYQMIDSWRYAQWRGLNVRDVPPPLVSWYGKPRQPVHTNSGIN